MFAPGELVADRYRIDELLGEGGFSAVYAATDVTGPRAIALKCFKPDTEQGYHPRTRARFSREIEMVARLRSPHTVRLFDHGETTSGLLYIVFEHIEGEDLDEVLRRVGRLDPGIALHVLEQLLDAVAEAHAMGLLHRDIKSSNVRVFEYMGDPFAVKLLDFGLARGTDGGHPGVTATGEFVGTPRYMAPEQLLDEPLTPATDIYCLGLVVYEMLFGVDVLSSNTVHHQLERLRTGHLIAPRAREGLPPNLVRVLEKMTAREPAARFQTIAQVQAALAAPAPSAPREPDTAPWAGRPADSTERPVARRWAMAVVAVGLLGALALVFWPRAEPPPPPPPKRPDVSKLLAVTEPPVDHAPVADLGSSDALVADVSTSGRCAKPRSLHGRSHLVANIVTGDSWLTYVPEGLAADVPAPLVILLHQQGHTADILMDRGGFIPVADANGFMLIAPHDPDYDPWSPSDDHVVGIETMLRAAMDEMCVDAGRVFLVGHGNGGALADHLACAGWARGLATHAMPRTRGDLFCTPVRPLPYAHFYPTKSEYEPYEGGESRTGIDRESVKEIEARWIERNNCARRPVKRQVRGSTCYTFDCETPFISCHVDGGHGWPGTPRRTRFYAKLDGDGPEPDQRFPMAELMWEFFSKLEPLEPMPQ